MTSPNNLRKAESAQVGIGTMIVFIATILVAAVAAAVLIDTSSNLQDKATATGNAATDEVGTAFLVDAKYGERAGTTSADDIHWVEIQVRLAAGASEVDLTELAILYTDGDKQVSFDANPASLATMTDDKFVIEVISDTDGSVWTDTNTDDTMQDGEVLGVMNKGDKVILRFGQYDTGTGDLWLDLDVRETANVVIMPEVGATVPVSLQAPNSFGTDQYLEFL